MIKRITWKAVAPMALVLCSISLLAVPASALEVSNHTETVCVVENWEPISPRYAYLSRLKAILSIDDNGYAACVGNADANLGYTCDATLELQQKNGSAWETIKEWSSSGRTNSFDESWYVKSGYDYRLKITAEVYDLAGKLVESAAAYSGIERD